MLLSSSNDIFLLCFLSEETIAGISSWSLLFNYLGDEKQVLVANPKTPLDDETGEIKCLDDNTLV